MTVTGRLRGWLAPALAALALCVAAPQAIAQTVVPVPKSTPSADQSAPPAATREDLQNMLETLRDPAKRDELAKQIETMLQVQQAEAPPPEEQGIGARMLSAFSAGFQQVRPVHGECRAQLRRHRKSADLAGGPGHRSAAARHVAGDRKRPRAQPWRRCARRLCRGFCRQVRPATPGRARRRPACSGASASLPRGCVLELLPLIAFGVVAIGGRKLGGARPDCAPGLARDHQCGGHQHGGRGPGPLPVQPVGTGPAAPPDVATRRRPISTSGRGASSSSACGATYRCRPPCCWACRPPAISSASRSLASS